MRRGPRGKGERLSRGGNTVSDLLSIGRSGLTAAKKSIETASHNIANVNTEGFTRKHIVQQTSTPIVKKGVLQGTGTVVKRIERSHNPFVEKKLNLATTNYGFLKERTEQLDQIENIFNELEIDGLNKILNKFYNSFRELSNNPEDETMRSIVRDNARLVIKDFKRIRETLNNLTTTIDTRLEQEVENINDLLRNISKLNLRIKELKVSDSEVSDLKDERDLLVRNLSEFFNLHIMEDPQGGLSIMATGIGTLVSGKQHQEFMARRVGKSQSSANTDGSMEIHFKSRPSVSVSTIFTTGKLGSMLAVRNQDQRQLRENIDNIAFELAQSVNTIHRRGFVGRPIPLDEFGKPLFQDARGRTTGVNFFTSLPSREGAALSLELSDSVRGDLSNIVTALDPNSPGDNRIALAISGLQDQKIMEDGQSTLSEYYLKQIGRVGLEANRARVNAVQAKGLLSLTTNMKERISGVNLDEEAANLVKFQHAYEASAKVIETAEEMFDTVLRLKR